MKKTLLSALMLSAFGVFTTNAQITITDANIASIGDNVEQAHDTLPTGITIGPSGANQTWTLTTLASDLTDTLKFRAPAGYPGAVDFPNSNMVLVNPPADSSYSYLIKNTLGLVVEGQALYQQGNLITVPLLTTIITFPSTMGTNYSGTWSGLLGAFAVGQDLDGPGPQGIIDSLKLTRGSNSSSNIDAWGDVSTPLGTFAALRQLVNTESIDTTWQLEGGSWSVISNSTIAGLSIFGVTVTQYAYDTTRTARWWSDDAAAKFPVVEMDYEANGTVNSVDWLKSAIFVGVNELNANNTVNLYPNPAATAITIETVAKNNSSIAILDVTGKVVKTVKFTTNKINISVTDLDNGIYFYNVYDVNGNILNSNKFIVAK